ncbi:MAG: histidine--tRNA ligase [Candidatus Thorarchaeota archaeon]|nr:MAG: histidine--tRNA ligase [Candidatus Thorarchaeota archaeon]RLI55591.1 MAG: histidine--tRNA ligase [Candidatus Thorarchaeota archaeon]
MGEMRTVRGMRDLFGKEMRVRNYLVNVAVEVFELFGYEPLDSPVMELWETLSAKGGEDVEAETFKFIDKGEREVGLRFDLTVPLARIVATNPHLPKPFKRYAIGKAWRYDRPQAGRYREFEQADVDIIGASSPAADAEVVLVALEFLRRVFGKDYIIKINSRKVLKGLTEGAGVKDGLAHECFRAIDKLNKIGEEGVLKELAERGIGRDSSDFLINAIAVSGNGEETLDEFRALMKNSETGLEGVQELEMMARIFNEAGVDQLTIFDMSLARGLDYYTGPVFEGRYLGKPAVGSILGGGRYDHLIARFGGKPTPATGISLGIGRLIDVLLPRKSTEDIIPRLDVYVAPIKEPMVPIAISIQQTLVREGVSCEVDLMGRTLKKLFDVADSKGARFMIIVGPRDAEQGNVSVRNMKTKETEQVMIGDVAKALRKVLSL